MHHFSDTGAVGTILKTHDPSTELPQREEAWSTGSTTPKQPPFLVQLSPLFFRVQFKLILPLNFLTQGTLWPRFYPFKWPGSHGSLCAVQNRAISHGLLGFAGGHSGASTGRLGAEKWFSNPRNTIWGRFGKFDFLTPRVDFWPLLSA